MMRKVVILEPDMLGHHAFWLLLIIEAYRRTGAAVEVLTSTDLALLQEQSRIRGYDLHNGVRLHVTRTIDRASLLAEVRQLSLEVGADLIFIAYLDHYWPSIMAEAASGRCKAGSVKLSGIWFHPHALDPKWRWAPPLGGRWTMRGRLHRFWSSGFAATIFASVYFLVGEGAARLRAMSPTTLSHLLPDPYEREPQFSRDHAREWLAIEGGRTVFLHIGSPEARKGLPDVIAAFGRLARGNDTGGAGPPLLLRVGMNDRLAVEDRHKLDALVKSGWALTVERYVKAEEFMEFFSVSDWVLIPYRKFRYSSGILANAIGACKPVIASDFGHIGFTVKADGLGLVYRHGSVQALLGAVREALMTGTAERRADRLKECMKERSPEAWIETFRRSCLELDS